jgi:hypothetical protein
LPVKFTKSFKATDQPLPYMDVALALWERAADEDIKC